MPSATTHVFAHSGKDGSFAFDAILAPGEYEFHALYLGQGRATATVTIRPGEDPMPLVFRLPPKKD